MTERDTLPLRHDFDPDPLLIAQVRDELRLFREKSSEQLKIRLAFVELCRKYAVDPKAPDAIEQLELKISELGRPLKPLTDEQVEAYIKQS